MAEYRPHLRAWRKQMGWTLKRLANEIGTEHTTILRWEKGQNRVEDATFARIAELYGITPAELAADPADSARAKQLHRILLALQNLDEGALGALAEMAERLPKTAPG